MSQGPANQRAKRIGRPTKLNPEIQDAIVESIRAGNFAVTAAEAAGIGYATYKEWMRRGQGNDKHRPSNAHYAAFAAAVENAKAEAEANAIQRIITASETDWRAAAWYLERTMPDKWGRRTRLVHAPAPKVIKREPKLNGDGPGLIERMKRERDRIRRMTTG